MPILRFTYRHAKVGHAPARAAQSLLRDLPRGLTCRRRCRCQQCPISRGGKAMCRTGSTNIVQRGTREIKRLCSSNILQIKVRALQETRVPYLKRANKLDVNRLATTRLSVSPTGNSIRRNLFLSIFVTLGMCNQAVAAVCFLTLIVSLLGVATCKTGLHAMDQSYTQDL